MLVPRLFGDPQSVDPYVWRLTGYFAIVVATCALPGLRPSLPLAFAFLSLTLPYSVWAFLTAYTGPFPGLLGASAFSLNRQAFAGSLWLGLALVMAVIFWLISPRPRPSLRIASRPSGRALLLGLGVTLAFLVVAFALPGPWIGREGVPLLALGGPAAVAYGVANGTSAIAQEVQFRGVMMAALERHHRPATALWLQALIFGVAHVAITYQGPAETFIPIVVLLGLIWGWMTQRTGSLLPAAMVHVVADLFVLAVIVSGLYGA